MPAQKCEENVLAETPLGRNTPQQYGRPRQARTQLLGSFWSSSTTLAPAKPGLGLVWNPTWCRVLPGVFAPWFLQDTLTTIILTPHLLTIPCWSRSSSSTVHQAWWNNTTYYFTYQQTGCFIFTFLSSRLCLASLLHRTEEKQEIILQFWFQFFLEEETGGVCRTMGWSQHSHKYRAYRSGSRKFVLIWLKRMTIK